MEEHRDVQRLTNLDTKYALPKFCGEIMLAFQQFAQYEFVSCIPGAVNADEARGLTHAAVRLACILFDIARGYRPLPRSMANVAPTVLQHLTVFRHVLDVSGKKFQETPIHVPAQPSKAHGVLTSEKTLEFSIGLHATAPCWYTMVFVMKGSRWVCTHADFF